MFFRKREYPKRGGGILSIFRLILSVIILGVLGLGLLAAYRSFSGIDPMKIDPKALVKNVFTGESAYAIITNILSFAPPTSISDAKKILGQTNTASMPAPQSSLEFKFAIVSDSHKDIQNLSKALNQARSMGAKFIIGLGDFSDVGTIDELTASKDEFDRAKLPYYLTAGDHDLWDSRNKNLPPDDNFRKVFGNPYEAFTYNKIRIIILYNSDNYFGIDGLELNWLDQELQNLNNQTLTFVFTSIPLYHPSSDHVLGKVNPKLKDQASHLSNIFKKAGINEVFAGDTHFYSRYTEPENDLKMTAVGAVTSERNPQAPRFALVDILSDGSYNVEDIEIK